MKKSSLFFILVGIFFLALIISPKYNFGILNKGIYFTHKAEDLKKEEKVIFFKESLYGSIAVAEESEESFIVAGNNMVAMPNTTFSGPLRALKINGKIECGTGRHDMITTTLLAALPLLYNENAKTALNIGLGCGLTLGILESSSLEEIDSIEMDKTVVEAAKEFNNIHGNALDDDRSNVIIAEARNFLLTTNKKYDIIVNELDPWIAMSSNVFSKEFFMLLKEHLNEDGIVTQYIAISELESADGSIDGFKIFYKTFNSVFPYVYGFVSKVEMPLRGKIVDGKPVVYETQEIYSEIILIGSMKPVDINNLKLEGNLKDKFAQIETDNPLDFYLFSYENLDGFIGEDIPITTDNNPVIEFIVARNLYTPPPKKGVVDAIKEFKGK